MKNTTNNTTNEKNVEKTIIECELSENELDQVNGGLNTTVCNIGLAVGCAGLIAMTGGLGAPAVAAWAAGSGVALSGLCL